MSDQVNLVQNQIAIIQKDLELYPKLTEAQCVAVSRKLCDLACKIVILTDDKNLLDEWSKSKILDALDYLKQGWLAASLNALIQSLVDKRMISSWNQYDPKIKQENLASLLTKIENSTI